MSAHIDVIGEAIEALKWIEERYSSEKTTIECAEDACRMSRVANKALYDIAQAEQQSNADHIVDAANMIEPERIADAELIEKAIRMTLEKAVKEVFECDVISAIRRIRKISAREIMESLK